MMMTGEERRSPVRLSVVGTQLLPEDPVTPQGRQEPSLSGGSGSKLHLLDLDRDLLRLRDTRTQWEGRAHRRCLLIGCKRDPWEAGGGGAATLGLVERRSGRLVLDWCRTRTC